MESGGVTALRTRNENRPEDTRSDSDTLCDNRITILVRLVHDWTNTGGIQFRRKKKIEGREGILDDEYERYNDPRRSGNSVREAERPSLFHSIHARTNISAGVEHLCQDAKRRQ